MIPVGSQWKTGPRRQFIEVFLAGFPLNNFFIGFNTAAARSLAKH
jgi:hypothetical protein